MWAAWVTGPKIFTTTSWSGAASATPPGASRRGHKAEAIATVPDEWVDLKSLVGPPARIRERYRAWEDSGADSLSVRSRQPEAIEVMAKAARLN
jgi:hypothetical protein